MFGLNLLFPNGETALYLLFFLEKAVINEHVGLPTPAAQKS